ncbi:hypothetical protein [Cellvibrio mixtus]|uniref:hypothetical protein n=1 Tax=Cellvibrio mixtus TaxID=39650 RepID=UPI000A656647|nr:hypothetical protein [Cellvibrio mixtus]
MILASINDYRTLAQKHLPRVYALATRQKRGVKEIREIFAREMRIAMAPLRLFTRAGHQH